MNKTGDLQKKDYLKFDLIALALGLAVFIFMALTARNGVSAPDESFYFTVTQRLSLGEKLIADEWNIAQLVHLLNVLPYTFFTKITGGTEGIILFMRYLFIAVNAVFYVYVYIKLRRFRIWGIAAALSFCAVVLQTIFSITYFTSAPMAALAFCLIIMTDEGDKKLPKLAFTGVLLACAILAEPYLIAGFIIWFITVILRQALIKKGRNALKDFGFILDPRVFFGVTLGAVAVFIPFMAYMIFGGSFEHFAQAFPYLAAGGEIGKLGTVLFKKCMDGAVYFGVPFLVCQLITLAAAVVLKIRRMRSAKIKRLVFLFASAALAGGYIYAGIKTLSTEEMSVWVAFAEYHNFSFFLFSPVPFLLSEKKQPRLTAFWASGAVFNVLVDASSAVILGSGGGLMRVAVLLKLSGFLPELFEEVSSKNVKAQRAAITAVSLCAAAALIWHTGYLLCETVYKPVEKMFLHAEGPLSAVIEKGPFKGLKTTDETADVYIRTLEDMDLLLARAEGRPVAVLDLAPYTYLYLGLPYGSYTAWFEFFEPDRLAAFWALRPDQEAAFIYLPYNEKALLGVYSPEINRTKLSMLEPYVSWTEEEGKAGLILTVTSVNKPEIPGITDEN